MLVFSCSAKDINDVISTNTSKLATPTGIYLDDENVLRWNAVENADYYNVSINNKDYPNIQVPRLDLNEILTTAGTYEVYVKALSNKTTISNSEQSIAVSIQFTPKTQSTPKTESKLFGDFDDLFTKEAYLGYGYDVIGSSYVNSKEIKVNSAILDLNKLKNTRLIKINERNSQDEYISGNSLESYQQNFEAKLQTKIKAGRVFSSSLGIKYKSTNKSTASALFYEYRHSTVSYHLVLQCDFEEYKNMLTESFKRDLLHLDIPTLFNRYGTHLITSVLMGGRFDLNYTLLSDEIVDTSKLALDLDTSLKAWGVNSELDASVDIENKASSNNCTISTYSTVFGGDYIAMNNEKAILKNYNTWLSSIEAHPALIGIRDINSLIPVWELLGDTAEEQQRKLDLQNYFSKYGQETYDNLLEQYKINVPEVPKELEVTVLDKNKNPLSDNIVTIGNKYYLNLKVTPETAPVSPSVTFDNPNYVLYNSTDNSIIIKDDIPNNTTIYVRKRHFSNYKNYRFKKLHRFVYNLRRNYE